MIHANDSSFWLHLLLGLVLLGIPKGSLYIDEWLVFKAQTICLKANRGRDKITRVER